MKVLINRTKTLLERSQEVMAERSVLMADIAKRNGFGEDLEEMIKLEIELYSLIDQALTLLDFVEDT